MSSFRKKANRNVSSTGLSGAERKEIPLLLVVPDKKSGHGNAGAAVWSYYGKLCYRDNSSTTVLDVDDNHRYCRLCLEREQELYRNSPATGHISRVTKYGKMTATGSLANHVFINHNVDVRNEQTSTSAATVRRQLSIQQSLFAGKDRESKTAETQFELSRDLCPPSISNSSNEGRAFPHCPGRETGRTIDVPEAARVATAWHEVEQTANLREAA
jgi:hypothetical protein